MDGNKRTSLAVCATFLAANGAELPVDTDANIDTWLALASGKLGEDDLAAWIRARIRPPG